MKVLIVDDEALVRRAIARTFKSLSFEAFEAADGVQGLSLYQTLQPDVLFVDVLMPGLTGPQLLEELGPEIKAFVVLMSAYAGDVTYDKAKVKVDLFLKKPFEDIIEEVQDVVKKVGVNKV